MIIGNIYIYTLYIYIYIYIYYCNDLLVLRREYGNVLDGDYMGMK